MEFLFKSFKKGLNSFNKNNIYFKKLHNILKNEGFTSKTLNKKRYLYKYKLNLNNLNFFISSKDYYYLIILKNNKNNKIERIFNNNIYLNFLIYYNNFRELNLKNNNIYHI
jgi:hypothetical protein